MPERTLPDWPRGMPEPMAAAYVGLSPGSFRSAVRPEVPPVRITAKRIVWLREALDAWLDRKAGIEAGTRAAGDTAEAEWDRALDGAR